MKIHKKYTNVALAVLLTVVNWATVGATIKEHQDTPENQGTFEKIDKNAFKKHQEMLQQKQPNIVVSEVVDAKDLKIVQNAENSIKAGVQDWKFNPNLDEPLVIHGRGGKLSLNPIYDKDFMELLCGFIRRTYLISKRTNFDGKIEFCNPDMQKSVFGVQQETALTGSTINYGSERFEVIAIKSSVYCTQGTAMQEKAPGAFVALVKDNQEKCFHIFVCVRGSQSENFLVGQFNPEAGNLWNPWSGFLPITQRWALYLAGYKDLFGPSWQSNEYAVAIPLKKAFFGIDGFGHAGFASLFASIQPGVTEDVIQMLYLIPSYYWKYVVINASGHSQGEGVDNYLAPYLASIFKGIIPGKNRIHAIGFSSPRTFQGQQTIDNAYAAMDGKDNVVNICSPFDVVTNVAPGKYAENNLMAKLALPRLGFSTGYLSFGHYMFVNTEILLKTSFQLSAGKASERVKLLTKQAKKCKDVKQLAIIQEALKAAEANVQKYTKLLEEAPKLADLYGKLYQLDIESKKVFQAWEKRQKKTQSWTSFKSWKKWGVGVSKDTVQSLKNVLSGNATEQYKILGEIISTMGVASGGSLGAGVKQEIAVCHFGVLCYNSDDPRDHGGEFFYPELLNRIFKQTSFEDCLKWGQEHYALEDISATIPASTATPTKYESSKPLKQETKKMQPLQNNEKVNDYQQSEIKQVKTQEVKAY